jgi:hypothetical protein
MMTTLGTMLCLLLVAAVPERPEPFPTHTLQPPGSEVTDNGVRGWFQNGEPPYQLRDEPRDVMSGYEGKALDEAPLDKPEEQNQHEESSGVAKAVGIAELLEERSGEQFASAGVISNIQAASGEAFSTSLHPNNNLGQRMVYVIATPKRFHDGRVRRLQQSLGDNYTIVRADPFFTVTKNCHTHPEKHPVEGEDGDASKERGIFMAHKNVWIAVALSPPSERALVLESDFSVGDLSDDQLRSKLDAAWRREEDYTNVGWCDMCYDDGARSPCWSCATGYIIGGQLARLLSSKDFCMASDTALLGACQFQDAGGVDMDTLEEGQPAVGSNMSERWFNVWAKDLRGVLEMDEPAKCSFLYEPPRCALEPTPPGKGRRCVVGYDIFYGIFQQDIKLAGVHHGGGGEPETQAQAQTQELISDPLALRNTAVRGRRRGALRDA